MSVLDTLKSLIGRANKDIEENLSKEAESVEEAADAIQTSSERKLKPNLILKLFLKKKLLKK